MIRDGRLAGFRHPLTEFRNPICRPTAMQSASSPQVVVVLRIEDEIEEVGILAHSLLFLITTVMRSLLLLLV